MYQQVNLYQPIFREQDKLFSVSRMAVGLGAFACGLVLLTGFAWWRTYSLEGLLAEIKAQEIAHQNLVDRVTMLMDQGETKPQIERRLATMALELDRRRQALRYLHSDEMGVRSGFADRMEALAREQVEGLWLRGALFTGDSGRLTLTGRTTNAELVTIYLARLATEPALAGTKLERMEIRQPATSHAGELEFTVSSVKTAGDKAAAPAVAANLGAQP